MSLLATINVHACDGCGKIAVLHTDDDVDSFAAHWDCDEETDICPECQMAGTKTDAD